MVATVCARHGLRQARPRVRDPPRLPVQPGGVLPAGRSSRACARHGHGVLLPTPADHDIWAYFDSTAFPPRAHGRAGHRGGRRPRADLDAGARAARQPAPEPPRGRSSRCSTWRAPSSARGRAGDHRARGPTTWSGSRWSPPRPQGRAGGDGRVPTRTHHLPHALPPGGPRRPDAEDCGRCDNCGGLTLSSTSARPRSPRPASGVPPGHRRAAPDVAHRAGQPGLDLKGKIGEGADRPGGPAAHDLGHGQALRASSARTPPTVRCHRPSAQAVMDVMKDWLRPVVVATRRDRGRRVGDPPDPDPRTSPTASRGHAAPGRRQSRSATRPCRRARARPTPRSASPPSAAGAARCRCARGGADAVPNDQVAASERSPSRPPLTRDAGASAVSRCWPRRAEPGARAGSGPVVEQGHAGGGRGRRPPLRRLVVAAGAGGWPARPRSGRGRSAARWRGRCQRLG